MITLDIARIQDAMESGAMTYAPNTAEVIETGDRDGWAVPVPGSGRVLGFNVDSDAVTRAITESLCGREDDPAVIVNAWYSPEHGYVMDLATVHNVERMQAVLIGDIRRADSVVNLRTGESVSLYIP